MSQIGGLVRQYLLEQGKRVGMAPGPIEDQREIGAGRREARRNLERPAEQRLGIAHSPEPRGKFGHHADRSDIVGIVAKLRAQQPLGNIEMIFGQRRPAGEEALIGGGKGGGRHRGGVPAREVSSKRKTGRTRPHDRIEPGLDRRTRYLSARNRSSARLNSAACSRLGR